MVTMLDAYVWSSHRGYLFHEKGWDWLHRDMLLKMFLKIKNRRLPIILPL